MILSFLQILATIPIALFIYLSWEAHNRQFAYKDTHRIRSTYDFIVVGAGSAGSVVAARLSGYGHVASDHRKIKVLLLEAGGPVPAITNIPGTYPYLQRTNFDWSYKSEPQENCFLSCVDRKAIWPRGKALGGSFTINGMVYVRGNEKDYDEWESLGCTGWGWKDVRPYFLRSEKNDITNDSYYHNTDGPLIVSTIKDPSDVCLASVEGNINFLKIEILI